MLLAAVSMVAANNAAFLRRDLNPFATWPKKEKRGYMQINIKQ